MYFVFVCFCGWANHVVYKSLFRHTTSNQFLLNHSTIQPTTKKMYIRCAVNYGYVFGGKRMIANAALEAANDIVKHVSTGMTNNPEWLMTKKPEWFIAGGFVAFLDDMTKTFEDINLYIIVDNKYAASCCKLTYKRWLFTVMVLPYRDFKVESFLMSFDMNVCRRALLPNEHIVRVTGREHITTKRILKYMPRMINGGRRSMIWKYFIAKSTKRTYLNIVNSLGCPKKTYANFILMNHMKNLTSVSVPEEYNTWPAQHKIEQDLLYIGENEDNESQTSEKTTESEDYEMNKLYSDLLEDIIKRIENICIPTTKCPVTIELDMIVGLSNEIYFLRNQMADESIPYHEHFTTCLTNTLIKKGPAYMSSMISFLKYIRKEGFSFTEYLSDNMEDFVKKFITEIRLFEFKNSRNIDVTSDIDDDSSTSSFDISLL